MADAFWEQVLTLLFPHKCFLCGRVLAGTGWLCGECVPPYAGVLCTRCGKPAADCICWRCDPVYAGATAPLLYTGGAREGMYRFKYDGRSYYAPFLAALMERRVRADFTDIPFDFVTYVPMHPKKRRQRGYCQTELLARALAKRLGLPVSDEFIVHTGLGGAQMEQKGFDAREANARQAFAACKGRHIDGGTVLLIDDVLTSGATVRRCAALLLERGAQSVYVVTAMTTPRAHRGCKMQR